MDRRGFLALSLCASGAALLPQARAEGASAARLTLRPQRTGNPLPADFMGLSYETAQLNDPRFFSPANTQLAEFLRKLSPSGVLRIGGNTAEYAMWTPVGGNTESSTSEAAGPDTGTQAPRRTAVTPEAIRNLRDFLDATGWSLLYSLNFGSESPAVMAEVAAYVVDTIGPKLEVLQFGNEPDLFMRNGVRKPDYGYAQFAAEWARAYHVVRRRVPHAAIAGPDTADRNDWLVPFARQFKREAAFLTHHYYAEGPPSDPAMTIAHLLDPTNPRLVDLLKGIAEARQASGLALRLAEGNSCYGGGKPGVSDTFASALWGADLMYQLAAAGACGVNFHGGGYGWYSPIVGTPANGFLARPLYYGMLMFAEGGAGALIDSTLDAADPLLTAYGLKTADGTVKTALFNKNAERSVTLTIEAGMAATKASVLRLWAPRLDDTADTSFGGAPVGADGVWTPAVVETLVAQNGTVSVALPKASAALVRFATV
jgi:hypothetical protein